MNTTRGRRGAALWFAALGAGVALQGCVSSSVHGEATTYTLSPWMTGSFLACGALLAVAGLLIVVLKKGVWPRIGGAALLLLGPALLGTCAYKAMQEYVTVADDRVEYSVGSVLAPAAKVVRFEDCQRLEFRIKEVAGERGRPEEEVTPYLILKGSGEENIGRVLFRGPVLDDLIARLARRGVPVVGDRRGL